MAIVQIIVILRTVSGQLRARTRELINSERVEVIARIARVAQVVSRKAASSSSSSSQTRVSPKRRASRASQCLSLNFFGTLQEIQVKDQTLRKKNTTLQRATQFPRRHRRRIRRPEKATCAVTFGVYVKLDFSTCFFFFRLSSFFFLQTQENLHRRLNRRRRWHERWERRPYLAERLTAPK